MLTRFFGQSKPINFLLMAIYMAVFYLIANDSQFIEAATFVFVLEELALMSLYILSMVIVNFIAKRNDLTKVNTYAIVIYASLTALFFKDLSTNAVISANIFVILALRRLLSLKTNKEISKKIFDAALWIGIASLFQFWTIIFMAVLYLAILFHSNRDWRNFVIPLISVLCLFILATTYTLLINDSFFNVSTWFQASSFDFSQINNIRILVPLSVVLATALWVSVAYFKAIGKASISQKPSMYLTVFALIASIAIAFLSPTKNGSELIFMFVPLSIMIAKYFERESEFLFKEILLWLYILMPILIPLFF